MTEKNRPDISDLERMLKAAGAATAAAEAHGAFCGRACLAGAAAIRGWQRDLLADAAADDVLAVECGRALDRLAAESLLKLEAGDMQFDLLLPDDEEPLQWRAAALADWCHGFMCGLVAAGGGDQGPQADALESELAAEILDDFSEITKAGAMTAEGEESEAAFFELVEYVRVSAQLIYDETAELRAGSQGSDRTHQ
jgi:uncharacterized protein YgfB (UPF0149 family)